MINKDDSILLVLPVPFFQRADGSLLIEAQAANGLDRWAENFERVAVAAQAVPAEDAGAAVVLVEKSTLRHGGRISLHAMPSANSAVSFARHYRAGRTRLASLIREHRYLSFAISGLFGDWAALACVEARRQKRAYSVWKDSVNHEAYIRMAADAPVVKKAKAHIRAALVKALHFHAMRSSALGLLHGADTYRVFAPVCPEPHLVHDIHVKASDQISADALQVKTEKALASEPLRIVYAGRADNFKGPQDWISVVERVVAAGCPVSAVWCGDGPRLADMKKAASAAGLADVISFPGFLADREALMTQLRDADVFLFCHKTPESPRCLVEALKCGAPIVGYDSAYPRELTEGHGGAVLTPINKIDALAEAVIALDKDRARLKRLIGEAARSGEEFSDEKVFAHRSALIKEYLP